MSRHAEEGLLEGKRIVLIIGGGIAAYKCLDLIRRLRERGAMVRAVMTRAAREFVTPLSVGALSGEPVFTDLFDLDDEREIGHIRLARDNDMIVVAPATADLLAKMAHGLADDLASTLLLASGSPVLVAPAMNPFMWHRASTQRNMATVLDDGAFRVGPNSGEMAERNEAGVGRMAEPMEIVEAMLAHFAKAGAAKLLAGRHVLITSGPTHEPIDPVRYIANRSSGKQGHAIAAAAAAAGARVTLVSGPVSIPYPEGVEIIEVETAADMLDAVEAALPADIGIFAAAVADWRVENAAGSKLKKDQGGMPSLTLTENPDILASIGRHHTLRPRLVVGFAAETDDLKAHARAKLEKKGADWIVANDVSAASGVMGGDSNTVSILSKDGIEDWPTLSKDEVAGRLIARIADRLGPVRSGHTKP